MGMIAQTFASTLTVCVKCGAPVSSISIASDGRGVIAPCGHAPELKLVPNPKVTPPA